MRKLTKIPTLTSVHLAAGEQLHIRTAVTTDVPYILDRARRWCNQVGFIPRKGLEVLVAERRCLIAEVNGCAAGYLLTSGGITKPLVVRHNTVERDLWERGIGTVMMRAVLDWAAWTRRDHVLVRTRTDIYRQLAINVSLDGLVLRDELYIGARGKPVQVWRLPRTAVPPPLAGGVLGLSRKGHGRCPKRP